jgi:hypothetical protein
MASSRPQLMWKKKCIFVFMKNFANRGHAIFPALVLSLFCTSPAHTQVDHSDEQTTPNAITDDSLKMAPLAFEKFLADSARMDSARQVQVERQINLNKEINALSRSALGEAVLEWHQCMDIEVSRAGRSIVQRFWFDDQLKDGPFIWHGDTTRNQEWLWFDTEQRRMATLFLNSNQGNYVSKKLAEMSGMMGNGTTVAKKRDGEWKIENEGEKITFTLTDNQGTYRLTLGEKDSNQAKAMINWLKLQPIEAVVLPAAVNKFPIETLQLSDYEDRAVYAFKLLSKEALDPAFSVDLSRLQINDPERNLNVIAREWAEKKKQGQDVRD